MEREGGQLAESRSSQSARAASDRANSANGPSAMGESNHGSFNSNSSQVPLLGHFALPPLPASLPPGDSSLLYARSDDGANSSDGHIDHGLMERHLMDVESSFIPVLSPVSRRGNQGEDDTISFDGARSSKVAESLLHEEDDGASNKQADFSPGSPDSPPTPPSAYKTPGVMRRDRPSMNEHDETDYGYITSSLETTSSSPTAAAVARTVSRATSRAMSRTSNRQAPSPKASVTPRSERSIRYNDAEATPKRQLSQDESSDGQSTVLRNPSPSRNDHNATDAGSTPGGALLQHRLSIKPSRFLRGRHGSQQSSLSSFLSTADEDSTDPAATGTDFALQSGGAVAGFSRHDQSGTSLSSSISLGSMVSEANYGEEMAGRQLATLEEEERNREHESSEDSGQADSPPETPRANSRPPPPIVPTDTVIAQHVKNVHVPESIAKEYRHQNGVSSPGKRILFAAPTNGRGRNLTLKEQSNTIERLSKENFDLKLKVMFLSDRLDKLSEEGVKEMISENVELRTGLAVKQRENLALKRKIRELEQKLKDDGERPQTGRSGASEDDRSPRWFDQEGSQEREEELVYLRERVEEYVTEIETLRNEGIAREAEKRKLAEVVKSMGKRRGDSLESREEIDVWKDLLEQETARREQADLDNQKLRDEVFRLRSEATASGGGMPGLNHTTNIYNITKKRQTSPSRPRSGLSERTEERTGATSAASTLVEEFRAECEQLRHENAELRREVGAQTSMLTSRNKERERLTAELEELKLGQRRGGGSLAGDSGIFERSASRANERSVSRNSASQPALADQEREEFENKDAELRDKINALKMQNQDLQRELDTCMEDFEVAIENKKEAEELARELQGELESTEEDIQTLQAERDEALSSLTRLEFDFNELQHDAQTEIDALAAEKGDLEQELDRLQAELSDCSENFNALQAEMRSMSDGMVRLEDDMDSKNKRIQELMHETEENNRELEELEKNLMEANDKINRLTVQQESAQSEISFLREEQDGDKIKIGDLEAAVKDAEATIHEEKERVREMEQRLANERHQREVIGTREKREVQKIINELNREVTSSKDEARRLRKSLTSREVEATEWKERLMELENNLREALGDLNGTRSSLLKSIAGLQRELENTIRELDSTKAELLEKDRLIKHRDELLESHALESRRLSDMLDKERQAHRATKHTFESFQKSHQHTTRTMTQQETRLLELENGRAQDRKKIAMLENSFKDQLMERNNLLLALWTRLSALCGQDWAHDNSLINGRALPTVEAISNMLPSFSKNLFAAVKTIETIVGNFKTRIRSVEKDLSKAYASLEEEVEAKSKKLDRLETVVRSGVASGAFDGKSEIIKLKDINRMLKAEIATLRTIKVTKPGPMDAYGPDRGRQSPSPSPSVPMGPGAQTKKFGYDSNKPRPASMAGSMRPPSVSEDNQRTSSFTSSSNLKPESAGQQQRNSSGVSGASSSDNNVEGSGVAGEQRWIYRLRELERRLKAEREARLQDRNGARKRLEEGERRNLELQAELDRGKIRRKANTSMD